MFGSISKDKGLLFVTYSVSQTLENAVGALRAEVDGLKEDRFLNTSPSDLSAYLVKKYRIEPVQLDKGAWYADQRDSHVDVRFDQNRWISDRSRPALVPGQKIEIRVPFTGDQNLLFSQSNTMSSSPPRAEVDGQEIVLKYEIPADSDKDIRSEIDRTITDIETHLSWQSGLLSAHNEALARTADQVVKVRRDRLLANSSRLVSLGIPVRARTDSPKTYALPEVRRKSSPSLPPASSTAYEPEPAWALEHYEHALTVIQQMTMVMERSPAAFRAMDEEALRQHFLVQLNGHFEGKATGETFNMQGKTDILLREKDKNVFIAECKFWKGPKKFGEAIDQLLSYTTWRDSKTAILVFNRDVEMSTVLTGVSNISEVHSNFKRRVDWPHETGFRYVFHSNGDSNREFILTVLVFDVPG